MLTKEKLAEKFKDMARLFPGIPSYQEREGLRNQDKVIRSQLTARIEEQIALIIDLIGDLANRGCLKPLADLDNLGRKLHRLTDAIRFASHGYAGLFSDTPLDEAKLAELYEYDLSLHENVDEFVAISTSLRQRSEDEWESGSLDDIWQTVNRLEERINKRKFLFTGQ